MGALFWGFPTPYIDIDSTAPGRKFKQGLYANVKSKRSLHFLPQCCMVGLAARVVLALVGHLLPKIAAVLTGTQLCNICMLSG